ncbi:MAG: helix-turn-helix transcriptional regulator [Actinomycetota bacterium]|nr:helix-turn-helix transcriptional regulator [Actinomycetota bacterium]
MAPLTLAYVTPEVLLWARESAGYSVEDAAGKINLSWSQLEAVENGHDLLTLRQAEMLAKFYGRPLATLFLSEPPVEEPQDTQFRRLPGAPAPPWPAAMQLLVRRIRERQDAATELYEALEEPPPVDRQGKGIHRSRPEVAPAGRAGGPGRRPGGTGELVRTVRATAGMDGRRRGAGDLGDAGRLDAGRRYARIRID